MIATRTVQGDYPTAWVSGSFTEGGKIGYTGSITNSGNSYIIGSELNVGIGAPAGPVPVNGATGGSNTYVLYDFNNKK